MKVPYGKGVANHSDPESWVAGRKGRGQALTGEVRAELLSRENTTSGSRRCPHMRKATPVSSLARDYAGPGAVRELAACTKASRTEIGRSRVLAVRNGETVRDVNLNRVRHQ